SQRVNVEAIELLWMAVKRSLLKKGGFFDESYRFPYYIDIDFNFTVRDIGAEIVVTANLPVACYPVLQHAGLSNAERTRLTKRNFYRFLEKWGDREDLLEEE